MPSGKTAPPRYEEPDDDEPDDDEPDDDELPDRDDAPHGSCVSWRDELHAWS
jgi:hypothetical protein